MYITTATANCFYGRGVRGIKKGSLCFLLFLTDKFFDKGRKRLSGLAVNMAVKQEIVGGRFKCKLHGCRSVVFGRLHEAGGRIDNAGGAHGNK